MPRPCDSILFAAALALTWTITATSTYRWSKMVKQKLGSALKNVAVEQGMSAATPGAAPTYLA
jgi:hypothetical protein